MGRYIHTPPTLWARGQTEEERLMRKVEERGRGQRLLAERPRRQRPRLSRTMRGTRRRRFGEMAIGSGFFALLVRFWVFFVFLVKSF